MDIQVISRYALRIFTKIGQYFNDPTTLYVVLLILGILIFVIGFYLLFSLVLAIARLVRKIKAKRKAQKALQDAPDEDVEEQKPKTPWYKKVKATFRSGSDPLSKSFIQNNKLLRDVVGGRDFLYGLPWYLMLGDGKTNKTDILNSISSKIPYVENSGAATDILKWYYYDTGLVLDFADNLLYDAEGNIIHRPEWQDFLYKLYKFHPERALDGVVLTFDAEKFFGKNKKDTIELAKLGKETYKKLLEVQASVSMNLPIYILITGTEKITGFNAFFKHLPEKYRNNMFGWSSPFNIGDAFSPDWMKLAFDNIINELHELRLEILSDDKAYDTNYVDHLFVFLNQFRSIQEPLSYFINEIFRDNIKSEGYFFRGVYFTGVIEETIEDNEHLPMKKSSSIFINELFKEKIFFERSLGHPSRAYARNVNRQQLPVKLAFGAILLLWVHSGYRSIPGVRSDVRKLNVSLTEVERVIRTMRNKEENNHHITTSELKEFGQELLGLAGSIDSTEFNLLSLPGTLVSNFKQRILNLFGMAFDRIIVHSLYNELNTRLNELVSTKQAILESRFVEYKNLAFNPADSKAFQKLKYFAEKVFTIERYLINYEKIYKEQDGQKLVGLMQELFGYKLPTSVISHPEIFTDNLSLHNYEPIRIENYKKLISEKLIKLINDFVINGIKRNDGLNALIELPDLIDELASSGQDSSFRLEDYDKTFEKLMQTIGAIETNKLDWLMNQKFRPSDEFKALIRELQNSKFMDQRTLKEMTVRMQNEYQDLREKIALSESAYLKTKLYVLADGDFQYSRKLYNFKDNLSVLQAESFMVDSVDHDISPDLGQGKILSWDIRSLSTAERMIDAYDDFQNNRLKNFEGAIQQGLKMVAAQKLAKNLKNFVVQSFKLEPMPIDSASAKEHTYSLLVDNYNKALPPLLRVFKVLNKAKDSPQTKKIEEFLKNKVMLVLADIDILFENEMNFHVKDSNFEWWTGDGNPIHKGYNVDSSEALADRIDRYVSRTQVYVNKLTKPFMELLKAYSFDLNVKEQKLLSKWRKISEQLNDYAHNKPSSSVEDLKKTLIVELKDLNFENFDKVVESISVATHKTDYFTSLKSDIIKKLLSRYSVLKVERLMESYNDASDFFNRRLAGRFPFAEIDNTMANADLKDLITFFNMFNEVRKTKHNLRKLLRGKVENIDDVESFVKYVDILYDAFSHFLEDPKRNAIAFNVNVNFDIGDPMDKTRYLMDLNLAIGADQVNKSQRAKVMRWTYGDPVSLSFSTASKARPSNPLTIIPNYKINNNKVTVKYDDGWGLLRLLKVFQAAGTLGQGSLRNRLKINIPLQLEGRQDTLIKYMTVKLQTAAGKKYQLMDLPYFPSYAPLIKKQGAGGASKAREELLKEVSKEVSDE